MSYVTYTTKALVCGTWSKNTADKSFLLFTREAGMLYADARSVREEKSKQRYALQDFTLVRVSLIRGKQTWRIGSIEALQNYFMDATSKEARGSVVNIVRFVRRFLKGEEAATRLFDYVIAALPVLLDEIKERSFVEKAVQAHILLELGYVDSKVIPLQIAATKPTLLAKQASVEIENVLDQIITKAITVSQL
jgi:recombinational DNA repair protein (RecF pathway)